MALLIGIPKNKDFFIELEQSEEDVLVNIDDENVAVFYADGRFVLHGRGNANKYEGRWRK